MRLLNVLTYRMNRTLFLEQINTKQEKAWESLYRYYYAPLCSYAEKLLDGADGAEDVVQECLIGMWNSSLDFKEMKALTAYLYKSVFHAVVSVLRNKKSKEYHKQEWLKQELRYEEEAKSLALQEEAISRFYEVLEKMPQQQQDILRCCLKGLKIHEIAKLLKISENTVKTQKKRAYLFVRRYYDRKWLQLLLLWLEFQ